MSPYTLITTGQHGLIRTAAAPSRYGRIIKRETSDAPVQDAAEADLRVVDFPGKGKKAGRKGKGV